MLDIAWAAGIYEGEGDVSQTQKLFRIAVNQKDPWILHRLRTLFGGSVKKYVTRGYLKHCEFYRWCLHGPRARGFAMTIWHFLSPRRKGQIRPGLLQKALYESLLS